LNRQPASPDKECGNRSIPAAVHPESYKKVVDRMAISCNCSVNELISSESLRSKLKLEEFTDERPVCLRCRYLQELAKPGRDPSRSLNCSNSRRRFIILMT